MKTSKYHHQDLPNALILAARQELIAVGVRGFSLRSVASRAGVSRTAPYRHFAGREGLLAELMRIGFRELTAALREADNKATGDDFDKLTAQGRAYLQFGKEQSELLELAFSADGLRAAMEHEKTAQADEQTQNRLPSFHSSEYDAFGILEMRIASCQKAGLINNKMPSVVLASLVWSTVHGIAVLQRERALDGLTLKTEHKDIDAGELLMPAFEAIFRVQDSSR